MTLSDEEQRILREIELHLCESDPHWIDIDDDRPAPAAKRTRAALIGLVVSLAATVYFLRVHYVVAFGAFLVAFAFAMMCESVLRDMGNRVHQAVDSRIVRSLDASHTRVPRTDDEADTDAA